ncbi:MAG: TRAP transporter large permease subunit, partial [Halalkalicoccus sp.]|nr:TRAP transporter large permease subunit [Halalkalicoccus sp.]
MSVQPGEKREETDELSEEEQQELIDELERRRDPRGIAAVLVAVIGIAFSAFQVWIAAHGFEFALSLPVVGEVELAALQLLQINAVHVVFALVLAFLLYPPTTGDGPLSRRFGRIVPAMSDRFGADSPMTRGARGVRGAVRWAFVDPNRRRVTPADVVCIVVAVLAAVYMLTSFAEVQRMRVFGLGAGRTLGEFVPALEPFIGVISALGIPLDSTSVAFMLGVAGVILVLEATRRSLGIYLTLIVAAFIVYARYGYLIPADGIVSTPFGFGIGLPYIEIFSIPPGDWATIIQNFWYNTENGVFGIPVTVSVQFIYIFILFGAILEMSGAGQWFIDLAYAITGHRKGGPAKASVLASGFMGTISGSSIANTVTTGAFTIPLMKRSGYRSEFAGAVEASASSGGQILPPVMGAAAFLIVEYTATPYSDVIIAAAVPAVAFFFGVWVMVHLEASRVGIGGLSEDEVIDARAHLRRGW